jgi:hypothetical protein
VRQSNLLNNECSVADLGSFLKPSFAKVLMMLEISCDNLFVFLGVHRLHWWINWTP